MTHLLQAGITMMPFSGIGPSLFIAQADIDRWWRPVSTNVQFSQPTDVRRKHRRVAEASSGSSASDTDSEAEAKELQAQAWADAGFVKCPKCSMLVREAAHPLATCTGQRTVLYRGVSAAIRLQATGDISLPLIGQSSMRQAVIDSLASEPGELVAAGWATVQHNTRPMHAEANAILTQLVAAETTRFHFSAQEAMEALEAQSMKDACCVFALIVPAVAPCDLPTEQQVTSFLQQAGKKKKQGGAVGGGKTKCSHCKGTGHNKKTCDRLHLDAEVARQQRADEDAARGAAGGAAGAAAGGSSPASPQPARVRKVVECQYCGGTGHNTRGCPHRKAGLTEQQAHAAEHMRRSQPAPPPTHV